MKVVIIDDQQAMHLILQHFLEKVGGVEIAGSFNEGAAAFSFLQENQADMAFVDIHMPKENGLELARRLRQNGLQLKLVFVTSHREYALSAFDVYAYDYITKPISFERLNATILRALSEKVPAVTETGPQGKYPLIEQMTRRELEILQLISQGLSNKEIATDFGVTEGTVKNHIVNIFGKLQVKNRVQAVSIAKELKLIP